MVPATDEIAVLIWLPRNVTAATIATVIRASTTAYSAIVCARSRRALSSLTILTYSSVMIPGPSGRGDDRLTVIQNRQEWNHSLAVILANAPTRYRQDGESRR